MNTTAFQLEQAVEQSEIYRSILNLVLVALFTAIFDKIYSRRSQDGKIIVWKNKDDDNQRHRKKWIKILRDYEPVERSFQEFKRITYTKKVDSFLKTETKSVVIGLFFALIAYIAIFVIIPIIINLVFPLNDSIFGLLIAGVNFFPAVYLLNKCKENPEIKSIKEFTEIDEKMDEEFNSLKNFFIYYNFIVGLRIYNFIALQTNILGNTNFMVLFTFWSLSLFVGTFTYKLVKKWKEESIDCLKKIINKSNSNEFPYIITNIPHIEGQLKDIFNEDFLILDEKGIEKTTFWSSIEYIHIKEAKKLVDK